MGFTGSCGCGNGAGAGFGSWIAGKVMKGKGGVWVGKRRGEVDITRGNGMTKCRRVDCPGAAWKARGRGVVEAALFGPCICE